MEQKEATENKNKTGKKVNSVQSTIIHSKRFQIDKLFRWQTQFWENQQFHASHRQYSSECERKKFRQQIKLQSLNWISVQYIFPIQLFESTLCVVSRWAECAHALFMFIFYLRKNNNYSTRSNAMLSSAAVFFSDLTAKNREWKTRSSFRRNTNCAQISYNGALTVQRNSKIYNKNCRRAQWNELQRDEPYTFSAVLFEADCKILSLRLTCIRKIAYWHAHNQSVSQSVSLRVVRRNRPHTQTHKK